MSAGEDRTSETPAVEAAPPADDAAVQNPGAAGEAPPTSPAPGAHARPTRLIYAWCIPCWQLYGFCCTAHAVEHIRGHVADFAAWEQEVASA